jgi:hypothetical protein
MRFLTHFCQLPGHLSCINLVKLKSVIHYSTQWALDQCFILCNLCYSYSSFPRKSCLWLLPLTDHWLCVSLSLRSLSWTFLSFCIHSSVKQHCPNTEHINTCEFQHLAQCKCITTDHTSLFFLGELCTWCSHVWCPIQTHTWRVRSRLLLWWRHTTSYSVANSQRHNTYQGPPKKLRKLSEDSSSFQCDGK